MCIQRTIAITIVIGGDRSALRRIGNRSWPNAWGTQGRSLHITEGVQPLFEHPKMPADGWLSGNS